MNNILWRSPPTTTNLTQLPQARTNWLSYENTSKILTTTFKTNIINLITHYGRYQVSLEKSYLIHEKKQISFDSNFQVHKAIYSPYPQDAYNFTILCDSTPN